MGYIKLVLCNVILLMVSLLSIISSCASPDWLNNSEPWQECAVLDGVSKTEGGCKDRKKYYSQRFPA